MPALQSNAHNSDPTDLKKTTLKFFFPLSGGCCSVVVLGITSRHEGWAQAPLSARTWSVTKTSANECQLCQWLVAGLRVHLKLVLCLSPPLQHLMTSVYSLLSRASRSSNVQALSWKQAEISTYSSHLWQEAVLAWKQLGYVHTYIYIHTYICIYIKNHSITTTTKETKKTGLAALIHVIFKHIVVPQLLPNQVPAWPWQDQHAPPPVPFWYHPTVINERAVIFRWMSCAPGRENYQTRT